MKSLAHALLCIVAIVSWRAVADVPAGYPSGYQEVITSAVREGKVVVYATTDAQLVTPLLRAFEETYPGVQVRYQQITSVALFGRYVEESAAGEPSADVLWSSAMDLQVKLVNDGYALAYRSPESPQLPAWAQWRDEAYGTTFEPIAFVYNRKLVPEHEVPHTHTELMELITKQRGRYAGRVAAYGAGQSGLGYLLYTQDNKLNPDFWPLMKAMRDCGVSLHLSTTTMIDRIALGTDLIGYNLLGSYALARAKTDPAIGVVLPRDYTLVISRLMFISRTAAHPNAAKLWLDFILSRRGQTLLATQAELYSVRRDIEGKGSGTELSRSLGEAVKPVTVGPGLLVYLDQAKHADFMKQWRQALGRQ